MDQGFPRGSFCLIMVRRLFLGPHGPRASSIRKYLREPSSTMRFFYVCNLLLVALSISEMGSAFLSSPVTRHLFTTTPSGRARAVTSCAIRPPATNGRRAMAMGLADAVPGPLKTVFNKKPKPTSRRTRTEGAELYRTLGVTPDADYMDVLEAVGKLKEKYSGDRKQIIRIEKAKDDIMALRLKQAVKGNLKANDEAREMDSYQSAKETYLKKKNSFLKVPGWAQGWFEWPDREHFNQCAYRHGFMALFGGAFPSAGVSLQALGGASCFALTMNRNSPPLQRDENGQVAEIRLPAKKTIALSFITVVLCVVAGNFIGGFAANIFGEYYLLRESYIAVAIQLSFLAAGSTITTWRDPKDGPEIAQRRGKMGRRD